MEDNTQGGYEEDTLQQALFGGNISGRRLRGVKINPIYQENEPGGRDGLPGDTQSESALPIGEIQIEMYESLPRSIQKGHGQDQVSPTSTVSSSQRRKPSVESEPANFPRGCYSHHHQGPSGLDSGDGGAPGEEGKDGRSRQRSSQACSSNMAVDSLPWTFLQERSPARREPVWGAFPGLEHEKLPGLREDREDSPPGEGGVKRDGAKAACDSPDSRDVVSTLHKLSLAVNDGADAGSQQAHKSSKAPDTKALESESPGGQEEKGEDSGGSPSNDAPPEYQAYFVTLDNAISPFLSQRTFPYDALESYSKSKFGNSDFPDVVHFAQHNHHHYSVFHATDNDKKGSDNSLFRMGGDLQNSPLGRNGYRVNGINGIISPEDGHILCSCSCHTMTPSDVNSDKGTLKGSPSIGSAACTQEKNSAEEKEKQKGVHDADVHANVTFTVGADDEPQEENDKSEQVIDEDHLKHDKENYPDHHQHSAECIVDFENNNNCRVLSKIKDSESISISSKESETKHPVNHQYDAETGQKTLGDIKDHCFINITHSIENENSRNTSRNGSIYSFEFEKTNPGANCFTGVDVIQRAHAVCKLCGCPARLSNGWNEINLCGIAKTQALADDAITKENSSPSKEVSALLKSDSILLRADELNAPAYLQRYLVEAQKNYMQRRNNLSIFEDVITADVSPSLSSVGETPPVPKKSVDGQLVVPDTGELWEDLSINKDTLSDIGDLGCYDLKKSCSGFLFKGSGGGVGNSASMGNSRQNSFTHSRQNSRKSDMGKHSSIEDVEAVNEDEKILGSRGSKLGSCSNRSASLKQNGLSIIHVAGTSNDPSFEMIVPYDETLEGVCSGLSL